MSGNAKPANEHFQEWFDLVDLSTDRVVGQITRSGRVKNTDPETTRRIMSAFDREVMVRDGTVADELGICFAGVETVTPDDSSHDELVFRNLGLLTGLVPQLPNEPEIRQRS